MQLCETVRCAAAAGANRCAAALVGNPLHGYAHQDSIDQRRDALNWVTSCDLKSVGRETSSPRIPMCRREVGAGTAGLLVGLDQVWMVVRFASMCDPFACVRPMCPVCVPAPPGIFLPVCVPAPLAPSESFYRYQYFGATGRRAALSRPRIRSSRGRAGVSVGLDGCEVRLCDPCARVMTPISKGEIQARFRSDLRVPCP